MRIVGQVTVVQDINFDKAEAVVEDGVLRVTRPAVEHNGQTQPAVEAVYPVGNLLWFRVLPEEGETELKPAKPSRAKRK